jgi:hypothetical protein
MKKTLYTLNSVRELYDLVEKNPVDPYGSYDWHKGMGNWKFIGVRGKDDLMKKKWSWPEAVDRIKRMAGFENLAKGKTWTTKWSWEDGQFGDGLRLMDGRKFLGSKVKVMGQNRPDCIQIHINISEAHFVSPASMNYKTYAAIKIVDEIESMGIRTEIWTVATISNLYINEDGGPYSFRVKVKSAEDSVSLSYLATVMSSWMLRYWFFYYWMLQGKCHIGLGRVIPYDRTGLAPGTLVIDNGQALDQNAADVCIKEQDEKFAKFIYGGVKP